MKILGIVGSTRPKEQSGVQTLVSTVLESSGLDYELVSLKGKTIHGCIACLGCAKDTVCVVQDDMAELRDKLLEADAYVIGAPNFFTGLNAITHAFLERLYQFRHQDGDALWGKLAVAVGVGGGSGQPPADDIERFLLYSFIETVDKVVAQGAASCFTCGYGETCKVGVPIMMYGPEVKITDELIPDVKKQPDTIAAAKAAGELLAERLASNHNRTKVTRRMQNEMMARFKESR